MAQRQHGASQRRGRGAYYAAKYGSRGSRNAHSSTNPVNSNHSCTGRDKVSPPIIGDLASLSNLLKSINKSLYPKYRSLCGAWNMSESLVLIFDDIQGDAYAPPSRARLRVPMSATGFSNGLISSKVRIAAFCDYLTRKFAYLSRTSHLDQKRKKAGWASTKGGDVSIDMPGQHVLPRTSCVLDGDTLELRVTVALPARGRSIEGHLAEEVITQILPFVVGKVLFAEQEDAEDLAAHVRCVDEQEELRGMLKKMGLIAFVADGAVLPREAGNSDLPLQGDNVVPFKSPDSLRVEIKLSTGRLLSGMGVQPGISLIVGGGFHGKSTLLCALQVGMYNHVPSDGRCFVSVLPETMSIRAEDGRFVVGVDISPFITNLPFGKTTKSFSTTNASGSTSQAANIIEAMNAGAKVFLIDEDLSATNFMMRDFRMQQLVPQEKEPITPMLQRIRALYEQNNVSCILVVGGAGDYFEVSDTVVLMDSYSPVDVTKQTKDIVRNSPSRRLVEGSRSDLFKSTCQRRLSSQSLRKVLRSGRGRVLVKVRDTIEVGEQKIDLAAVAQLVERSQSKAIGAAVERLGKMPELESEGVAACIDKLYREIDEKGLDELNIRGERLGCYVQPRLFEIHAALNRLRGLCVYGADDQGI